MRMTSTLLSLDSRRFVVFGLALALSSAFLPVQLIAQTGPRTVTIVAGDDMKYDTTTIQAKPGEQIRIRLTSKGKMPKMVMAHNVVVLTLGTDGAAFTKAGLAAKATDYIAPEQKKNVVAATALAGNGETVEVTFKVPTAPGSYPYVCTFPGHFAAGMKGTLVVK